MTSVFFTRQRLRVLKPNLSGNQLPEHDLKRLLELCTKDNIFLFNGLLYQQIDGETMGSPLAPLLANVFMSHVEKLLLNSELKQEVDFWFRNVDDIFCNF